MVGFLRLTSKVFVEMVLVTVGGETNEGEITDMTRCKEEGERFGTIGRESWRILDGLADGLADDVAEADDAEGFVGTEGFEGEPFGGVVGLANGFELVGVCAAKEDPVEVKDEVAAYEGLAAGGEFWFVEEPRFKFKFECMYAHPVDE